MSRGCRRPWAPLKSHGQPEDHGIGVCWSHNKPVSVSRCQSKSGTGSVYCCVPRDFWRHRARSDLTEIRARQSARVRVQIKVDVNRVRSERAALSGYLGVGKVYVAEGEKDAAKKLGPPATLPLISEAEAPVAVVRFEKTISAFAS